MLEKKILLEADNGIIQISPEYYKNLGKPLPGTTVSKNKNRANELAKLYIAKWPKKILSGGRPVRQGLTSVSKKMLIFMNKHPEVTDQQILDATQRYVNLKVRDNWVYATCSDYFILKNDSSQLEAYIQDTSLGSKESTPNSIFGSPRKA
jgi:hypothetical protein